MQQQQTTEQDTEVKWPKREGLLLKQVLLKDKQTLNGSGSFIRQINAKANTRMTACDIKGMGNVIVVDVSSALGMKTTYIFAANISSAW